MESARPNPMETNPIREHRKRLGLSLDRYAESLGVTRQRVIEWEQGRGPSDRYALLLVAKYGHDREFWQSGRLVLPTRARELQTRVDELEERLSRLEEALRLDRGVAETQRRLKLLRRELETPSEDDPSPDP